MRQELLAMQRRLGLTTLFVTHDQEEAMTTADRMAVLDKGVVQQIGTPTTLYDYPVNTFVAGFVGTMNLLPGRVRARHSNQLTLAVEGVGDLHFPLPADAPAGDALTISFRPHSLRVDVAEVARDARFVWMPGTIEASEFLGEFTRYRVRVGAHSLAVDHPHHVGLGSFPVGSAVSLGLESSQVRLFAG
jgi:iron(III) transport system ATP-binding protein